MRPGTSWRSGRTAVRGARGARQERLPGVLILGGGELGSAVAHRLKRAGLTVFVADLPQPSCIRREVCFATALVDGAAMVERVSALRAVSVADALAIARADLIPVIAVPGVYETGMVRRARAPRAWALRDAEEGREDVAGLARALGAQVVVDARMLKRPGVISARSAPLVVGLGPGLRAPKDAHAVIETNRGHNLGQVIRKGGAEPNTGKPGEIGGRGAERLIRAPASGVFKATVQLGSMVRKHEMIGRVMPEAGSGGDAGSGKVSVQKAAGRSKGRGNSSGRPAVPVRAKIPGLLRGLIADGIPVERGQKIGDVDPRGRAVDHRTISDKGRAISGGALEAIMNWWVRPRARR